MNDYTFNQINKTMYELRVGTIIFLFDIEDTIHAQMVSDFSDTANIERFINLLEANPSDAFDSYNGTI